ncbi:MAG: GNAT family N-acetyltransferase [Propionibacteriaceae bacterium]|jgi:ribosomal protein S18 acetylase RimI-like enzyme|nr:GNAT family N-acetyltransferase [Propionibacteriaceae bacterium]
MADMLVRLYGIDYPPTPGLPEAGIAIKRASIIDRPAILDFVASTFPDAPGWTEECSYALFNNPGSCYIAVHQQAVVGFACYDATGKGFFGPTGVDDRFRHRGIGKELLLRCLWSMREAGYAYAIIGWPASDAIDFYQRCVGATLIEDSEPGSSIYHNLIAVP